MDLSADEIQHFKQIVLNCIGSLFAITIFQPQQYLGIYSPEKAVAKYLYVFEIRKWNKCNRNKKH